MSSDRNQLLAMLLGLKLKLATGLGVCYCCLPPRLIVSLITCAISSTYSVLLAVALPPGNDCTSEEAQTVLSRLIVRRLNAIDLCGKRHTRNMYRREHRTGEAAEVQMSIEQQLFAALLQKKVSEYLRENCADALSWACWRHSKATCRVKRTKPLSSMVRMIMQAMAASAMPKIAM